MIMLTVSNLRMKRARFVPLCRVLPSLLLLQLFLTAAYPQTPERLVTGTVADAETGKAVPYVTVKAVNAADSLNNASSTTLASSSISWSGNSSSTVAKRNP